MPTATKTKPAAPPAPPEPSARETWQRERDRLQSVDVELDRLQSQIQALQDELRISMGAAGEIGVLIFEDQDGREVPAAQQPGVRDLAAIRTDLQDAMTRQQRLRRLREQQFARADRAHSHASQEAGRELAPAQRELARQIAATVVELVALNDRERQLREQIAGQGLRADVLPEAAFAPAGFGGTDGPAAHWARERLALLDPATVQAFVDAGILPQATLRS